MDSQGKYKAQSESNFFVDGASMRTPVAGTVARGELREDDAYYRGKDAAGKFITRAPMAFTEAMVRRGEERYNIYCVACHGANGKGVVPGAPNFTRADGPLSQSDEALFNHIKLGFKSPGSAMAMPPKGGNMNLTDGDIKTVLKYLRDAYSK